MRPFGESSIDTRLGRVLPHISNMAGQEMTETNLSAFASLACRACLAKGAKLTREMQTALYYSCYHLLGKVCSERVLKSNMHRVIANWNFIHEGQVIPEWRGEQITADVLFMALERCVSNGGHGVRYNVKTKIKTGLGAGIILWFALYDTSIYRFMDKFSGCSKLNCAAEELAGMRARITMTVEANVPRLQEWNSTGAQRQLNRELTDKRTEPGKCSKMIPCNTCKCTVSQCPLAVWADKIVIKGVTNGK